MQDSNVIYPPIDIDIKLTKDEAWNLLTQHINATSGESKLFHYHFARRQQYFLYNAMIYEGARIYSLEGCKKNCAI